MRWSRISPRARSTFVLLVAALALSVNGDGQASLSLQSTIDNRQSKIPAGVLLITIDTLPADHLGCYGYRRGATPAMDGLAKQSAKFEHAFAPVPLTLPSHAALLTGTYPLYNGVRDQPGFRLPDDIPTLAESFARTGYATAAVLGSPVLSRRFGLSRGFEEYDDHFGASTEEQEAGLPNIKRPAETVVRLALAWLDSRPAGKPFFLWLHFYDPHLPYRAPEPFRSRFADRPYDGEVAYTDWSLGRLFAGLRSRGLFDSTVMALTADHGEGLGDHGESTHGYFIYDSTLRVPLLVKPATEAPAVEPPLGATGPEQAFALHQASPIPLNGGAIEAQPRGIKAPVSLVDLAVTLLHLAGINAPASMQGTDFSASIVSGAEPRPHPVYAETMYPLLHLGWNPLWALVSQTPAGDTVKYIQAPRPELYDLGSDPGETRNEYLSRPAEAAAHRQKLDAFVKAHAPTQPASGRGPVSAETARLFASLGYVAAGGAPAPAFTTSRRDPKDGVGEHEQLLRAAHAFQAHQPEVAERLLGEVLRKDPQQPLALDYLGTIQFLRHDLERARATYARLLQAAPYYATAYIELAHTEALLGERAEAERLYRRATEMDPSNPRPPRELGILLLGAGKLGPAEDLLQQALKLEPADVYALNALGEAAARQQHYEEAAGILQRALAAAHGRQVVLVRLNLGFVYLQLRRFPDVERLMSETIQLAPRQPQAYALLGAARLQSGDSASAREAFRRALTLDPHNPMALEGAQALGLAIPR
jgi:arylsulfatase A-like enzyme/cytochrome c-type biogenesis protein CcmH/NrfG